MKPVINQLSIIQQLAVYEISPAPRDHFSAGPDCSSEFSPIQAHSWCWWLSNYPCWDRIFRRYSYRCRRNQIHPTRSFDSQSTPPRATAGQKARWSWWLESKCL